ncbi:spore germination protein [Aminipila luticellarii]|uniref:Spore germination protein n=1 Tax=Aminipila luticellarii TaxID=2507160 RepID=A0A410PUB2_9FIRM|nr:spore germination protein [Aminipila luticellarii]QAT42500.1 spore germination protein [Aminipila luticellarii]
MQVNNYWAETLKGALPVGESFDMLARDIQIGDKKAVMFYVDGLVTGQSMPLVMSYLFRVDTSHAGSITDTKEFIETNLPYLNAQAESKMDKVLKFIFSGLIALAVEGFSEAIIIDARFYPDRGVEEPSKEKSLRGAKDGFTESFMTNIALIRRRIRDPNLIFKSHTVGKTTQTDISLAYVKGKADDALVQKISDKLKTISIDALSVGDQTIAEHLLDDPKQKSFLGWLNPYPKVRYTQRPDVVAAHLTEGKIAIVVDTTPTVILLPTGIFDFLQDVDDYYFPAITGNYFRLLRTIDFIGIIFITPLYLLFAQNYLPVYDALKFFIPRGDFAISLFWQFILLEFAIDALKLASLNTPDSLGMSLSVIGALILGEFAVSSGWFIPQTILCMAVVALASFTQPSIELGYAIKFMRMFILIGIQLGAHIGATSIAMSLLGGNAVSICAIFGALIATAVDFISIGATKTLAGTSYLYPLFPFDGDAMKHLVFRTKA